MKPVEKWKILIEDERTLVRTAKHLRADMHAVRNLCWLRRGVFFASAIQAILAEDPLPSESIQDDAVLYYEHIKRDLQHIAGVIKKVNAERDVRHK